MNKELRRALAERVLTILAEFRDPEYQLAHWVEPGDLQSFDDVLMDFLDPMEGFERSGFFEGLLRVYRDFGIEVGNAILPVYVALRQCEPKWPTESDQLAGFISDPEWLIVVERASTAYEIVAPIVGGQSTELGGKRDNSQVNIL